MSAWLLLAVAVAWPELTFEQALKAAERSPAVAGVRAASARREADGPVLGQLPQLTISPGIRMSPASARGFEFQSGLVQQFSLSGADEARSAADQARRAAIEGEAPARLFEARLAVAAAWHRAWSASQGLAAAEDALTAAREFRRRVGLLAEARALTAADVAEADAFVAEGELSVLAAQGEAFERGVELARLVGREGSTPVLAKGEPPQVAMTEPRMPERIDAHPATVAARREAEAAAAKLKEVHAVSGAWVQAGVLFQRESPDSYLALATGTFALPTWDVHRHERNDALSEQAKAESAIQASQINVRAEIVQAIHEVEHTHEVLETCREKLIPAAERLVEARAKLADAGDGSVFEELAARRQLVEARARLSAARSDEALARVRWRLIMDALGTEEAR